MSKIKKSSLFHDLRDFDIEDFKKQRSKIIEIKKKVKFIKASLRESLIYILSNKSFEGWYKVGVSENIERRMTTYQTGDPYRAYKIEFTIYSNNCKYIEKEIHNHFEAKGEWIKTNNLQMLIDCIKILSKD